MECLETYRQWVSSPALSDAQRDELRAIAGDEKEIESRFGAELEFGTAGLRGVMALGTNRMNIHVIRHVTQAFAEVILSDAGVGRRAAVCYDTRHNSPEFAREAAGVLAANGIGVLIFGAPRPTPELSFAIRRYGCAAGINITASHNTREYNGYKVYWSDGAQLPPRHATEIAERMSRNNVFASPLRLEYDDGVKRGLITLLGAGTDEEFLENVMAQTGGQAPPQGFSLVYTPFHGTGGSLVPEALKRLGVNSVICVPEQMIPDGDFPSVISPNPENPEAFELARGLAVKSGAALVIGTDPDCDRVAALSPDKNGGWIPITGNQMGVLLLNYIIDSKTRAGIMPERPAAVKSLVTTEMARRVAQGRGVACYDTFTGFKFIAARKNELEASGEGKVIFAFEEAIGYMAGDYVRDKDAVTASVLIAEMAAWYYARKMTLLDALDELYGRYGHYAEKTVSLVMPGIEGLRDMRRLMAKLRDEPPDSIAGMRVRARRDYLRGIETDARTSEDTPLELSGSDMLRYILEDGVEIVVRPSGTEPKIKVYILAVGASGAECEERVERYEKWASALG
jgi:phosphoglucomutase